MKKLWGFLLCIGIISVCSLGMLFTGGTSRINNVKAAGPALNNLEVKYHDDYNLKEEDGKQVDLIEHQKKEYSATTYDYQPVRFKEEYFEKYENGEYGYFTSAAGTTATITVTLKNNLKAGDGDSIDPDSWIVVQRATSLSGSDATWTTLSYGGDSRYDFVGGGYSNDPINVKSNYNFGEYGVYRLQIFTYLGAGGPGNVFINTFIFVVPMEEPKIDAMFNDNWEYKDGKKTPWSGIIYSKQFVKADKTKDGKTTEGTRITLGFLVDDRDHDRTGNPIIYAQAYGNTGYKVKEIIEEKDKKGRILPNKEPTEKPIKNEDFFLQQIGTINIIENGEVESSKFTFKLKSGKEIINGKYVITFIVQYNEYNTVTANGAGKLITGSGARTEVNATIIFENAPKSFPVWASLLICAAILAALGLGFFGCNYVIQYTQVNNIKKEQHAQMKRAETDRQNIERLRESMAADTSNSERAR